MNVQATFAATLADEWACSGVRHAVISPGSRSTPLAIALDGHPDITLHVRLDERSGSFFALGIGIAAGVPAVVLTTSGTAAAEVHAAVVEADLARVPLIICTADRPPELQGVGAPQTIDQTRLYGHAPRLFADPGVARADATATWRPLAARVFAASLHHPAGRGPVHLNLPFREPLVGTHDPLPPGRPAGRPWMEVTSAHRPTMASLPADQRGIFVAGAGCSNLGPVYEAASQLGWPVLADPRAGGRLPSPALVAAADAILSSSTFASAHQPEVVVRIGAAPASRRVNRFVAEAGAPVIVIDAGWPWSDPEGVVSQVIKSQVAAPAEAGGGGGEWLESWAQAEAAAQTAIDEVLVVENELTEPSLARLLYAGLHATERIFVGSSMPVRDLEWFAAPSPDPPAVLANRGANGIDGVISTALGVAAASPAGSVTALLGDLSFLHDLSALVWGQDELVPAATIVVVDNAGGGIFEFLPQAQVLERPRFERLFGTPQVADLEGLVRSLGHEVTHLATPADLATLAASRPDRLRVARVHTDRQRNAALHAEINAHVARQVDQALR
jgi:2-succinyl-5-enolpyruvyl-6-hydroxy-3-cyclohexene-1-carboxylate synthase